MIDYLLIKKRNEVFEQYIENEKDEKQLQLKKVNIFVGENNSGKSRFMRELFLEFRKKEIKSKRSNGKDFLFISSEKEEAKSKMFNDIDFPFISLKKATEEFDEILLSYNNLTNNINNKLIKIFKDKVFNNLILNNEISFNKYFEILNDFNFVIGGDITDAITKYNSNYEKFKSEKIEQLINISYSTYIPILRSLKKIQCSNDNPLTLRTISDYFKELPQSSNVFCGENLYDKIEKLKNSLEPESTKVRRFEDFLSIFFNNTIKIRPIDILGKDKDGKEIKNTNKDLYIKIGDGKEHSIQTIGDGIQAIIILAFPLFLNSEKKHLLFIEEPELNLHPGFQREFLKLITSDKFPNTQVFLTTHSNHLLDLAIENSQNIAVYSFRKKRNTHPIKFELNEITKRAFEALDLLGVNSSSVFLSNCTIWVEGISERLYFRHYLELYY